MRVPEDYPTRLLAGPYSWIDSDGNPKSLASIALAQLGEDQGKLFLDDYTSSDRMRRRSLGLIGGKARMRQGVLLVICEEAVRARNAERLEDSSEALLNLGMWLADAVASHKIGDLRALTELVRDMKNGKVDESGFPQAPPVVPASENDIQVITEFARYVWEHGTLPSKRALDRAAGFVDGDGLVDKEARECRKRLGLQHLPKRGG